MHKRKVITVVPTHSGDDEAAYQSAERSPFSSPKLPWGAEQYPDYYRTFDTTPLSEGADSDDDDSRREQYRWVADWNKCEDNNYFSEGYTSSENSTIPSDAEEEEDIPRLPRRRLNFANEVAGENVNVADENAVVAWVTSIVLTYMKERLPTKPLTIRKMVLKKKTVKISYFTALRARHMCLEKIYGLGSYERSFRLVPELCHQIKASNPENIAVWSKDNTTNEFQGLCIAYKASLEGFKVGCRPLIALDGFPLKSKYRGVVLTASSVDGNNGMFPIAIYICLTETQETWSRFLCILKPFLMELDRTITFFSDHEKGVNVAVY